MSRILVTGGAGFVGCNLVKRLVAAGHQVRILDSLARAGSERNAAWLKERYDQRVEFRQADVRDEPAVRSAVEGVAHVFHLAAQVAVTTSLAAPREDFEVNARGTLNVLEAARSSPRPPGITFSSTNKVYGALADLEVRAEGQRYLPPASDIRAHGVPETRALEFHSPYGCSKGAAEQYVLDYARSYGLDTVVLRMSCIYGPHQHGNEDQGWVAHFARCAISDTPVTIYGDGMQVRDVLYVEDLIDAFAITCSNVRALRGQAFNMGGGPGNAISLLELIAELERATHRNVDVSFDAWRVGDQKYYVSDVRRFGAMTGWAPRTPLSIGLKNLCAWLAGDGVAARSSLQPPAQVMPVEELRP